MIRFRVFRFSRRQRAGKQTSEEVTELLLLPITALLVLGAEGNES